MSLQIRVEKLADPPNVDATRIVLEGRLDSETSPRLAGIVREILAGPSGAVLFDMKAVDFVTSAGIRVVMTARQALVGKRGSCALVDMQPHVDKIFEIVKALDGLTVLKAEQVDAHLASLGGAPPAE